MNETKLFKGNLYSHASKQQCSRTFTFVLQIWFSSGIHNEMYTLFDQRPKTNLKMVPRDEEGRARNELSGNDTGKKCTDKCANEFQGFRGQN